MANTDMHTKFFRAEKSNQNKDDFRVLAVGVLVAILIMLISPESAKFSDGHLVSTETTEDSLGVCDGPFLKWEDGDIS